MPGMAFKRSAAVARKAVQDMEEIPYRNVVESMASAWPTSMFKVTVLIESHQAAGTARPSFATRLIDRCLKDGVIESQDRRDIEGTVGVLYAGMQLFYIIVATFQ